MELKTGRDMLIALAAIGWADGLLAPNEAAGIRAAAKQLGLGPEDERIVEAALTRRVDLTEVETVRMDRFARLFTYAVAHWIARLDGLGAEEERALELLGDRLGLSRAARGQAREASVQVGEVGDSTAKYDLARLERALSDSIAQIGDD